MHAHISFGLMIKTILRMEKGMMLNTQVGLIGMILLISCIDAYCVF